MNLETLKDPSKVPNSIKFLTMILLLAGVVGAGYMLDTSDQMEQLTQLENKEQELKTTWAEKKKQAVNLEAHRKQLVEIEVAFGTLLRQLPNKSEMDSLLNDVNQAGLGRNLSFDLFRPSASEVITEFYAEQPVSIVVSGSYHDMGTFAEDVSKLSRIVNLGDMNMRTVPDASQIFKGTPPKLVMEANVRTYRYLDDKEKQRAKK